MLISLFIFQASVFLVFRHEPSKVLKVEEASPKLDRTLRNHLEHFDQRLDELAQGDDGTIVVMDRFIAKEVGPFASSETSAILRKNPPPGEIAPKDGYAVSGKDAVDLTSCEEKP